MNLQSNTLVRKQFFISTKNVEKLDRLMKEIKGSSAANIVRAAIEAYDPHGNNANAEDSEQAELIAIAQAKVREAIEKTENTIQIVDNCLKTLSKREA